jgi:hypothetical protein
VLLDSSTRRPARLWRHSSGDAELRQYPTLENNPDGRENDESEPAVHIGESQSAGKRVRSSFAEQTAEPRTALGAWFGLDLLMLVVAAMAAVGGGNVPEHLLDVRAAARERRSAALPTIDSPAHQARLLLVVCDTRDRPSKVRDTSSMSRSRMIFGVTIVAPLVD